MGRACGAYGGEGRRVNGFGGGNLRRETIWKTQVQMDRNKMDLQEVGCWDIDWIELAQDRNSWWALVNAVINLLVS
jgi:hypothetical protein